jgi:hypothetical protein
MSFGESLIFAGFIQKTVKGGPFVKRNQGFILWHICGKVLEDSRGLSTKAEASHLHVGPVGPLWAPYTGIF